MLVPHRLKAARTPLLQRQKREVVENGAILPANPNRRPTRPLRAVRRLVLVLLWTVVSMLLQAALLLIPGRARVVFARVYWSVTCRLFGMRVRTIGVPARRGAGGRPVLYVSNHSSWLDIAVLGGRLDACFVSKQEVGSWPFVNLIARLGRTVYVRRSRAATGRERDDMISRLRDGDNLVLFPEGTSSDGSRVLPFRSAFLSVAEQTVTDDGLPALVQPISVVYDRLGYLPTGRASRPLFAWYGDMNLGSHVWRLAQFRGLRATVLLHAPLDPRSFANRKALAQAAWAAVADGAATLRQNRPARPIDAPAAGGGALDAVLLA